MRGAILRSAACWALGSVAVATGEAGCQGEACNKDVEGEADSALLQTNRRATGSSGRQLSPDAALSPERAMAKTKARTTLVIETDLEKAAHRHRKSYTAPREEKDLSCQTHAERTFKRAMKETGLALELTKPEMNAFRLRFTKGMQPFCKTAGDDDEEWAKAVGQVLEQEKPLMTAAKVESINAAGLGFKAKMRTWLTEHTEATKHQRLGYMPRKQGEKPVRRRNKSKTGRKQSAESLPVSFRAEDKWPMCADAILRIHDQGHCGSCWAFSGLAPVDARMCIVSNGTWVGSKDILSRLHVLACAPTLYTDHYDGCMGGSPSWTFEMMASMGVVSTNCLPYLITGRGTEHFENSGRAPACVSHCQQNYNKPMGQDAYISPGIAQYDELWPVFNDPDMMAMTKQAMYEEGPVSFAFEVTNEFFPYAGGVFSPCDGTEQANHAVYAFGWGVMENADGGEPIEFIEALNSWGTDWGVNGTFRIHPMCICEFVIPGTIESTIANHSVEEVNEFWPWDPPMQCPVDEDGCVTDMEGDANYTASQLCFSSALNGKKIRVEEFETEYNYDYVKINGNIFWGSEEEGLDIDLLTSIIVDENGLKFVSDTNVEFPGFKLCPVEPTPEDLNETSDDDDDDDDFVAN